jgi:hypothetical protein
MAGEPQPHEYMIGRPSHCHEHALQLALSLALSHMLIHCPLVDTHPPLWS